MVEVDKTISKTATVTMTVNLKWILADTEPAAPEGYARDAPLDIDLGTLGKLWGFRTP